MTQLWWNWKPTCHATYWMYIPGFKLISQMMLKKVPKTRTDGHFHGIIRPFFLKRAYKKLYHLFIDCNITHINNNNIFINAACAYITKRNVIHISQIYNAFCRIGRHSETKSDFQHHTKAWLLHRDLHGQYKRLSWLCALFLSSVYIKWSNMSPKYIWHETYHPHWWKPAMIYKMWASFIPLYSQQTTCCYQVNYSAFKC